MSYETFGERSFSRAEDEAGIIARATEGGWFYKEGMISNKPFDDESDSWWLVIILSINDQYYHDRGKIEGDIEPSSSLKSGEIMMR